MVRVAFDNLVASLDTYQLCECCHSLLEGCPPLNRAERCVRPKHASCGVVPRKLVNVSDSKIYMQPRTQTEEKKEPTLMNTLFAQRREAAGHGLPTFAWNLR